jgi:hypothetical protein
MRESSGIYCAGRDQSASNTSADAAEAGLFQRNIRTHWGPINTKRAEIKPDCDAMLQQVQQAVDDGSLCSSLL